MADAIRFRCPTGFDFGATVGVVRRGPDDPLNWWDGARWRRLFSAGAHQFLLEASWEAGERRAREARRPDTADPSSLVVRRLEGSAPLALVRRLVARIFGLDDPGPAISRRVPPRLRSLIRAYAGTLLPGHPTLFEALVQTVLGQQLHVRVANRHREAFVHAFGRCHEFREHAYWTFPDPQRVAAARRPQIRKLGISGAKAGAILAIARSLADGRLSEHRLAQLPAAEAIGELSTLPGIGRWTSEWVLLRGLRRFEIVPAGDLAVRKAVAWAFRSLEALTEQQVRDATIGWSPYGGLIAYRLLVAHRQAIG